MSRLPRKDSKMSMRQDESGQASMPCSRPNHLLEKIEELLKENTIGLDHEGQYVPNSDLSILLEDRAAIKDALGGDVDDTLITYISKKLPKAFAASQLVFNHACDRKQAMETFQNCKFTDDMLDSGALNLCKPPHCKSGCLHAFPKSEVWSLTTLKSFEEKCWQFLIPTFDSNKFKYHFDHHRLLPFKARSKETIISSGNFSQVRCVEMLADKLTPTSNPNAGTILVAHKTLSRLDVPEYNIETEWEREAKAHKEFNNTNPHLVRSYGAYQRVAMSAGSNTYHLVLEWADGGNLHSFWQSNHTRQVDGDIARSRGNVRAMLKQLHGLSGALKCMHSGASAISKTDMQVGDDAFQHRPTNIQKGDPELPGIRIQDTDSALPPPRVPINAIHPEKIRSSRQGLLVPGNHSVLTTGSENWRHGDIKPENILRFTEGKKDAWLGTLKLADLGRAQQHLVKTQLRKTLEKERWRTQWYEPPDLSEDLPQGSISRLFDIWSMGCVIFECIIWMLYGWEAIGRFQNTETTLSRQFVATPYWTRTSPGRYAVAQRADTWMQHILKHVLKGDSAIGDLMILVRDKLLKIDLPLESNTYTPGSRTNANDMTEEIAKILTRADSDGEYAFGQPSQFEANPPDTANPELGVVESNSHIATASPTTTLHPPQQPRVGLATVLSQSRQYTNPMTNDWEFPDDHAFASIALTESQIACHEKTDLCETCQGVDIMSAELTFTVSSLETGSDDDDCPLCKLVLNTLRRHGLHNEAAVTLFRHFDSFFARSKDGQDINLLRLCCSDYASSQSLTNIPVGAPDLYEPPKELYQEHEFMRLPKAWLNDCDSNHITTCSRAHQIVKLPKRLVDVQNLKPRIVESSGLDSGIRGLRYIAFSHVWGVMPPLALTTVDNLQKRGSVIPSKQIPRSFADAIAITRSLGCRYLWIDSLCINQGPGGDFDQQAQSMETIFTNAYCVVAAASATSANEGFLKRDVEIRPIKSVKVDNLFVSAVTNDFERDVLQSPLSRRGWVLQERALARRTIFFTENQMYWECGDGVRSETLRKFKNDKILLLGDANFPSKTLQVDTSRGIRIHLWTLLFKQYSTLNFTFPEDRSVAIEGLMTRLATAFKTHSLHGLFESFWGRCLLWRRPQNGPALKRIPPGKHTKTLPPTWSWMAVSGEIDFLSPEGGKVDWNHSDVVLPPPLGSEMTQEQRKTLSLWPSESVAEKSAITATAFSLTAMSDDYRSKQGFNYDTDSLSAHKQVKAVIVCTSKDKQAHHVLLVTEVKQATMPSTYERVGVALLPETCIDHGSGVRVAIA